MKTSAITNAVVAAALAATGCLNADVKSNQICASNAEVVPGAPEASGQTELPPVVLDLTNSLPNLDRSGVSGTVLMQQIEITTTSADLSGIEAISATVTGESGSTLQPLALNCSYQKPSNPVLPLESIVAPCSGENMFDYLKSQQTLTLLITLAGSPPATSWQADVGACFSVEVVVDYTKL